MKKIFSFNFQITEGFAKCPQKVLKSLEVQEIFRPCFENNYINNNLTHSRDLPRYGYPNIIENSNFRLRNVKKTCVHWIEEEHKGGGVANME